MHLLPRFQNVWPQKAISLAAAAALIFCLPGTSFGQASGFNQTGAGPYDYNNTSNWVGGTINGVWDSGLLLTTGQTVTFASDTALSTGLSIAYDGGFNVTFTGTGGARTLTLGGDVSVNTVSTTRTIVLGSVSANSTLNVDLGGQTRTLTVGSGRSLGFVNVVSNGGIIANGGTVNFSGANTYNGTTVLNSGVINLNGAGGSSANSDFTIRSGSATVTSLTFNGSSGSGITRAKSVNLYGVGGGFTATALLNVTGNSGASSVEQISGALRNTAGTTMVSLSPNAARNTRLNANSLVLDASTITFFRGANLGLNTIASNTANSTNISFTSAPTLVGGAGAAGTSTVGIVRGAVGSSTSGASVASGLMTYDSTYGLRLLTASEYTSTITSGQSQLDNVRFSRASGGPSQDVNLTSNSTIGSLSFNITGNATDSGVAISGDAGTRLVIASGAIFASQQVTANSATNAMTISVPTLDLNGVEGTIVVFTNGVSNGNTLAPLQINSAITNDGGNGLTIGGTGEVIFGGNATSTYTGVTTINSGILRLDKGIANIGLTTDLVMNGGTLLKNSNAIADSASVTINGGVFMMDTTLSSGNNGNSETITNFTMNGGSFGNHGSNAVLVVNGNATLNASQLGMNPGGDITVGGTTILSGGQLLAKEASSNSTFNAVTTLNAVTINNTASGAYTAILVNAHATSKGGLVVMNGDLAFIGNDNNTNTTLIASSDTGLANQGLISLNGTRTFNIGNGAAAIDLSIVPAFQNGTSAGGLTKTGAGTLAIAGASTYSGNTTVSAGTLLVNNSSGSGTGSGSVIVEGGTLGGNGTISGSVTIKSGGTLSPGNSPGLLTVGSLVLESGSSTVMEVNGTASRGVDFDAVDITVAGGVSFGGNLTLNFTNLAALGNTTNISLFGYTGSHSGDFAGLVATGFSDYAGAWTRIGETFVKTTSGGQTLTFSELTGSLTVVPEPATWVLLAGSLTVVMVLRRRKE